jgi:hypothetical protein
VWVKAYNGNGDTPYSPRAKRTTSHDIPDFFYHEKSPGTPMNYWDSGFQGDSYKVEAPTEENYKGKLSYGRFDGGVGGILQGFSGTIEYFDVFDNEEAKQLAPHTQTGKYGETMDGNPCGVFIIKYDDETKIKRYQGVYYWGQGKILNGSELVYFSNSYGLGAVSSSYHSPFIGNPETATLPEALERFTLANMNYLVAFVAVPWRRQ